MDLFADISYPEGYSDSTKLSGPAGWNSKFFRPDLLYTDPN